MSKNVIAYNCDYLVIRNSVPVCTHPDKQSLANLCHPFDLACDQASFTKILGERKQGKPCIECDHYCQSQVFDAFHPDSRCGDHFLSIDCPVKDRCRAKVLSDRQAAPSGFCKIHQKPVIWFSSCTDHRKEGDLG